MTQFLHRESQIPRFFVYPKFLLAADLSERSKIIYMLLLDRARLSMQTENWQDEQHRIYVYYTVNSLASAVGKSQMTVKNALKELEQQGLIFRYRQGAGKPNRIYVKVQTENLPAGETVFYPRRERNLSPNKNKRKRENQYSAAYICEEGESL